LSPNRTQLIRGSNNENILPGGDKPGPPDRELQEAFAVKKLQQLLGTMPAAQWPKALSASSGQNDNVAVAARRGIHYRIIPGVFCFCNAAGLARHMGCTSLKIL
jgi:hypothetical protein